jgi:hypothetical protein
MMKLDVMHLYLEHFIKPEQAQKCNYVGCRQKMVSLSSSSTFLCLVATLSWCIILEDPVLWFVVEMVHCLQDGLQ